MKQENRRAMATLIGAGLPFLSGCLFQPPLPAPPPPSRPIYNLTGQVEVLQASIVSAPCVSMDTPPVKGTCHRVVVKWQNKGREPIGNVRAKIQTWDASGNELPYSLEKISIFVAREEKDRIAGGQTYDEPAKDGFLLLMGEQTPVKAKVTVVYADNSTPSWPDNSSLYAPDHHE